MAYGLLANIMLVPVKSPIKDAALGLSDDDAGAGYNRARQQVLAANIELLELHYTVKQGHNGSKPTALPDPSCTCGAPPATRSSRCATSSSQ